MNPVIMYFLVVCALLAVVAFLAIIAWAEQSYDNWTKYRDMQKARARWLMEQELNDNPYIQARTQRARYRKAMLMIRQQEQRQRNGDTGV